MRSHWFKNVSIGGDGGYDVIFVTTKEDYELLVPLLEREGYFFKSNRTWRTEKGNINTKPWEIFKENTALVLGDKLVRIQGAHGEHFL